MRAMDVLKAAVFAPPIRFVKRVNVNGRKPVGETQPAHLALLQPSKTGRDQKPLHRQILQHRQIAVVFNRSYKVDVVAIYFVLQSNACAGLHFSDGYFSFVTTLSPPRRFIVIWFFAASNSMTTAPSTWNLSCAVASSGTADPAPGG